MMVANYTSKKPLLLQTVCMIINQHIPHSLPLWLEYFSRNKFEL